MEGNAKKFSLFYLIWLVLNYKLLHVGNLIPEEVFEYLNCTRKDLTFDQLI